jgi:hypothetical protein
MKIISERSFAELRETLADIEHGRWSHWQRYMHEQAHRAEDGSLVISAELAERWQRQMDTSYQRLSEAEKQSDRDQVDKYLPLVLRTLGIRVGDVADGN